MSNNNDTTNFGYHVVCLIDVLGQKDKLSQWAQLPEGGKTTPEFVQAIKQSVGTVLGYRDQFIGLFRNIDQGVGPGNLDSHSKEAQDLYRRFKKCDVWVERFSDAFVFSSPIPNMDGDASVVPVLHMLYACCYAMLLSLATKIPVRGAITLGAGAVLEDGSFYGPALAETHHLECEIANYPRVVVSPNLCAFLAEGVCYSRNPKMDETMRLLAVKCRDFLCQDVDGYWIVDFLGNGLGESIRLAAPMLDAVRKAYDFVQSEANKYRQDGNAKLAVRYYLLQQYFESRLSIWGIQQ